MDNALWLIFAVPEWYFSCLARPFGGGLLTIIPAIGAFCLLVGLIIGLARPRWRLTIFLLPFFLTEILVAVSGFYRGKGGAAASYASDVAMLATVILSILGIYICKGTRISACLLSVFSITYYLFGVFVATMSFSDDWL